MDSPVLPSYASGSSAVPLLGDTVGDDLARTVAAHGGREAVVDVATGRRWTYREFADEVDVVALGLADLGVAKGDRVGIWALDCAEWTIVQYATARIGAVLVTINPAYCVHELEYVLRQARRACLVFGLPVDRGKAGSKLHVLTDAAGVPLSVAISAANVHDRNALRPLVQAIPAVRSPRGAPPAQTTPTARRQGLRLRPAPNLAPHPAHHPTHRPHRHRTQPHARPPPMGRRTNHLLAAHLPTPGRALGTLRQQLHRPPHPRRHPHLLQKDHLLRRSLIRPRTTISVSTVVPAAFTGSVVGTSCHRSRPKRVRDAGGLTCG